MKKWLYVFLQWTWAFPQNILGFLLSLKHRSKGTERYRHAIVSHWNRNGSISLGMFLFLGKTTEKNSSRKERLLYHEYGHTFQSLILGPFYLLIIGIPSFIWANSKKVEKIREKKKIDYYQFYTEKWADSLGIRFGK